MRTPYPKVVKIGGKDYLFALTYAAHLRVKFIAEVSLTDCVADVSGMKKQEEHEKALDGYRKLMNDFDRVPVVMYAILKPELDKAQITTIEQFGELLTGPVITAGARAITEALIDFFLDDPRGRLLANAVELAEKAAAMGAKAQTQAESAMNRKMTEMETTIGEKGDAAADAMIRETLTNSLKTLPESWASILAPSR